MVPVSFTLVGLSLCSFSDEPFTQWSDYTRPPGETLRVAGARVMDTSVLTLAPDLFPPTVQPPEVERGPFVTIHISDYLGK